MAAAKIFKKDSEKINEYYIMDKLRSPWILKAVDYNEYGSIYLPQGIEFTQEAEKTFHAFKEENFPYIIMELAENGELFDYLEICGSLNDSIARYYIAHIISALDYMHSKGIAHRDIKLENILLSKEFGIKIADFGLSSYTNIKSNNRGTTR